MMGFCHGGNMLGNHYDHDDENQGEHRGEAQQEHDGEHLQGSPQTGRHRQHCREI